VDGVTRPGYLDEATGRQYVSNDDSERLDGEWLLPEEEADTHAIVE
jgi:hypothetical protein